MAGKKTIVLQYQKKYLRKHSELKTGRPTRYALSSEELSSVHQPMIDHIGELEGVSTSLSTNASEQNAEIIINQHVQCEREKSVEPNRSTRFSDSSHTIHQTKNKKLREWKSLKNMVHMTRKQAILFHFLHVLEEPSIELWYGRDGSFNTIKQTLKLTSNNALQEGESLIKKFTYEHFTKGVGLWVCRFVGL